MKVVFTICSNNYLAQAKTLGDSLMIYNPDYHFVIGLVDRLNEEIDYTFFNPYEIIPIENIGIDGFDDMFARYNITELNTSVKPFIFHYLFSRNSDVNAIIYLDPDIIIYQPIQELEKNLLKYNIILTPHFFTPIYDKYYLSEPSILNAGLYNLGFLAVKRSEVSEQFLKWWMIKLKDQCYIDFINGFFVDQLWINFVPLYFENILILKHLGYNVAYWNLHERYITGKKNNYTINSQFQLIFYHFSGFNFGKPNVISKHQDRFTFDERKDILPLFEDYTQRIMINQYQKYFSLPCYYVELKKKLNSEKRPSPYYYNNRGPLTFSKLALKKILNRL
jgi:hypothetical protein